MTTLKLFGVPDERLNNQTLSNGGQVRPVRISHAVRIDSARSGGVPSYHISDLADQDVIELTFEGEIRRWLTVAELKAEFAPQLARGRDEDEFILPVTLPAGGPARGPFSVALKALRVFDFDPVEDFAGSFAQRCDEKLMPQPGLFFFPDHPGQRGQPLGNGHQLDPQKPSLLFIHGTFSSTAGSFGKLAPAVWQELRQFYQGQILGFEHRTLSQSPVENLLDLLAVLPKNARLNLVSHSRGGVLGELLCRIHRTDQAAAFDELDLGLFTGQEQAQLAQLAELLAVKNPRIERFVRVAAPGGGTTLASGRLDRWLEVLLNLIGKLTGAEASLVYGVVTDLLLELKKQSANAEAIPGIAAMVPGSAMIRMLNRPDLQLASKLAVISGDAAGAGLLGHLKIFFTDLFYREQHDLAVQTRAMYGGARRVPEGLYYFESGSEVDHFHYFSNPGSAQSLKAGLLSDREAQFAHGFHSISEALRGDAAQARELSARSYQKRSGLPQPSVFLVPGIMGSHLAVRGNRIWIDIFDLVRGAIDALRIEAEHIQPQYPVALAYANLIDYLSNSHEVIPFAYDWRISIQASADRLAQQLRQKFAQSDQPVRIVAHSMGGLVSRAMFGFHPDVFELFQERPGCRLVLLGVPNQGSFAIPRLLLGREKTLNALALIDLKHNQPELLKLIARFPGVLQLLPTDNPEWDFFQPQTWQRLSNVDHQVWIKPDPADLAQARELRNVIDRSPLDPAWMVYVAGFGGATPIDIEIAPDRHGNQAVHIIATDEGDGRVPWRSGTPPGLQTWYMHAGHGDLAKLPSGFPAIYELLEQGATNRLSQQQPAVARAGARHYRLLDEAPDVYPTQTELEQYTLGITPDRLTHPQVTQPVQACVAHGDLAFSQDPVAVGHYEGDSFFSAESYLDYSLKGRLSARQKLGIYPGPIGSCEVLLNPESKPGGAIVVGLGKTGELSAQQLCESFKSALVAYAIQHVENIPTNQGGRDIRFTSLLVGTSSTGLSVEDSLGAILNSILQANQALARLRPPYNVRIGAVQFVEVYLDLALLATRALRKFADQVEFQIDEQVRRLPGGRRRIYQSEPPGWWSRMQIKGGPENTLVFSILSNRARNEEVQLAVQRRNIDRLIDQAVHDPSWSQRSASPLYELLIPNRLRTYSPDLGNMVLMLDQETTRYPWELMYDRHAGSDLPMAVAAGMIRQLTTSTYRQLVIDVTNRKALVVGDPEQLPAGFTPLPGARQEAQLVADLLQRHKFEVTPEIGQNATQIMSSLFSDDYRILHLAGHGVFEEQIESPDEQVSQRITGMVLGSGVYLTAAEVEQMGRVPELVFVNCCYLGLMSGQWTGRPMMAHHKFAASLSRSLIEIGVKAVVVAGWAIDDNAALTFAEKFYQAMLTGACFGEAILQARRQVYEQHGDRTNTWGAYQCYGDPFYCLLESQAPQEGGTESRYVDLAEALVDLGNFTQSARIAAAQNIANLRRELEDLYQEIKDRHPAWLEEPQLNEALGFAFGEVDLFERAVQCFEIALQDKEARLSVRAIEQLGNFRVRWAVQVAQSGDEERAQELIAKSLRQLRQLQRALGETSERSSLIAAAYKRCAQISRAEDRREALAKMERYYRKACDLAPDNPYPRLNQLAAQLVQYWMGVLDEKPDIGQELQQLRAQAVEAREAHSTDFWRAIGVYDCDLVIALLAGDAELLDSDFGKQYIQAWQRFGSARELRSVIEHLNFLVQVLERDQYRDPYNTSSRGRQRREIQVALAALEIQLQTTMEG